MISSSKTAIRLALSFMLIALELGAVATADVSTSINANFNSTAIAAGRYVWFTAVTQTSGLGTSRVTVFVRKSTITFTANGSQYTIPAPDTNITFDPSATSATATFDSINNCWQVTRPLSTSDNTLLSAVEFPVPQAGLPGGITNVKWQLNLSTDTAGVGVKWKWAAAVYSSFSTSYGSLGVKPVDDQKISQYQNMDHAGTPENYKPYVTGGATGSGGTNYVGLYGGTVTVTAPVVVAPTASVGGPYFGYVGQAIPFNGIGSVDPQGYPLSYSWSFGDTATGTGATPAHAYSAAGTFTVTLTVTDGRNATGTSTTTATVTLPPPPQISASQNPSPNGNGWNNSGVTVTFTCNDSISGIYSCTPPITVSSQGANQLVQGTAVNNAGESATASVYVSIDGTAPTVTAVPAPVANANGWNNTAVTVSFSCADTLSGVASCPSTQTVSGEGAAQTIAAASTDNAGNTASANVTLNIDQTAPVVSISSPANGAVFTSSMATVSGTVSDALSGVAALTCNGTVVIVSNGSFSCGLQLVSGSNTIQVQAVDLAGNTSSTSVTVTYNAVPPTQLFITPTQASLLVGQIRTVSLVGQVGQAVSGATWTISDPTIVNMSSDDPPQLTALAQGAVTLTASYASLSATTTVNVYVGTVLPVGTPIWAVDPLPNDPYVVTAIPANPVNPGDPDIYSVEANQMLRAFAKDGRQLWVSQIVGPSSAPPTSHVARGPIVQGPTGRTNSEPSTISRSRGRFTNQTLPGAMGEDIEPEFRPFGRLEASHMRLVEQQVRRSTRPADRVMATPMATASGYTTYTLQALPTNDGGSVALEYHQPLSTQNLQYDSLVKMGSSGKPVWQYDSQPGGFQSTPAIGPDGTMYEVEEYQSAANPYGVSLLSARVLGIDGTNGTLKFADNLPSPLYTSNGGIVFNLSISQTQLSVMPDGSLQLVFPTYNKNVENVLCIPLGCPYSISEHDALLLYKIQPDGATATLTIDQYDLDASGCVRTCGEPANFADFWLPASVIPDGQNGTLAGWSDALQTNTSGVFSKVTHFDASGGRNTFDVPLKKNNWGLGAEFGQNLVLGENNTAFATDDASVTAFDVNSGTPQWQWTPTLGSVVTLLASNDPGGVSVLDWNDQPGSGDNVLLGATSLDASGAPTDLPTTANITAPSNISLPSYFDDNNIVAVTQASQTVLAQSIGAQLAELTPWTLFSGGPAAVRSSSIATKDVTVVAWINGSAVTFPPIASVSQILVTSLSQLCAPTVGSFLIGNRILIGSDFDRQYANAFLISKSGNHDPGAAIDPVSYGNAGDFRGFNRFQVAFQTIGSQLVNPHYLTSQALLGNTVDSCNSILTPASSLAPEAHPDNGKKGISTTSPPHLWQLNEGRVGPDGQLVNMTLNYCTITNFVGLCNAPASPTVPYVWSLPEFDANGKYTLNTQIFPTYSVFESGKLVNTIPQQLLETFIKLTATSQIKASDIQ